MKKLLKLSILIALIHAPIYAQWHIAVLPHENTLGDPQWNWLSLQPLSKGISTPITMCPKYMPLTKNICATNSETRR